MSSVDFIEKRPVLAALSDLDDVLESVYGWMRDSGIQNVEGDEALLGSINAWFETDTESYPFVYSEITGYWVTLLCTLYHLHGNQLYLERAQAAGEWLLRTTHEPNGGFRCLYPLKPSRFNFKQEQIYAFDVGMVLNGLVELYRATRQERFLASAVTAGDWLVYSAQKPNGSFYPVFQIDDEKFFESDKEWSTTSGSYHAKNAIGLLNLADLTHKQKYRDAAVKICDFALGCQKTSGRFVSFLSRGGTNAHPHCYSCEGLWVAGRYLEREDYLEASARGTQWLLDMQSEEGYIPRRFLDDQPIYHERVDAISQTLRLAVLHLAQGTLHESYRRRAERLVPIILRNQAKTDDVRSNGGLYFGRSNKGEVIPHVNSWVTAFASQALRLYRDSLEGKPELKPFHLV